ncbi:MAG: hypothetical protein WA305_10460, partial [Candidatus Acidiferrales bacterium]
MRETKLLSERARTYRMYFFYRILTAAGMFILAPYFALRGWRAGEPARALRERLGSLPPEIAARARASAGAPNAGSADT